MNISLTRALDHAIMLPTKHPGRLLTAVEVASLLNLSPYTVRKWARQGKLLGTKVGDDWRFKEDLSLPVEGEVMGRHKEGYNGPRYLIKKRGSPYWYINWKGICKSTETDNLLQAQMMLAEEQQRYWAKQVLQKDAGQGITFAQLIKRYLRDITPEKRSPKSDHTNARKPVEYWGQKKIDSFCPQDLYRYQEWRKAQHVEPKKDGAEPGRLISGATINRELALVKHALKKAVRWGYLRECPIPEGQVEGMREEKRDRYLTDSEIESIKTHSRASALPEIIDLLYLTAQRSGRILRLEWKQIDLSKRIISFEQTSKNKKAANAVWINDRLMSILQRLSESRKKQARISPWVFTSRDGLPIRSVKTAWTTACRKAGIENARIHDIRHKAITDMSKAGVSLAKIKTAVGHSQIQTTDGYTHLRVEDVREAFEVLK